MMKIENNKDGGEDQEMMSLFFAPILNFEWLKSGIWKKDKEKVHDSELI